MIANKELAIAKHVSRMPTMYCQLGSVTCFKRDMFLDCQWYVAIRQTCIEIVEDVLPVQMKHVLGIRF